LNKQALRILHLFGNDDVKCVRTSVGPEQEYFLNTKEMYEQKGTASLGISLYLQEGGCGREYEKIRIGNPMLSQTTELGSIPKESIEQINSAVRKMLVDFYNEYQRPVDEVRKEYEKKTRWAKFQLNMFGVVIFFGTLCGLFMSIVFRLLK